MQLNFPKPKTKSPLDKESREAFRNIFGVYPEQIDIKKLWDQSVKIGLDTGHLSRRADGAIVGKGDPADWFDAVDAVEENE